MPPKVKFYARVSSRVPFLYRTGRALLNIEVTVSSITKCLNTSVICRKVTRCDKKLCVVLIEADILTKLCKEIYPSL